MFQDILHRVPERLVEEMRALRLAGQSELEVSCQRGLSKAEAVHEQGVIFIRQSLQLIMDHFSSRRSQNVERRAAYCVNHVRACPLFPAMPSALQDGILCSAAGINCYDFSSMGISGRFLGESAFPFVIWLSERLVAKEHCFIVECVPGFDHELLASLVQEVYELVCLRICPSAFGLPISRDRKYMLLTSKRMQWDACVREMGHQVAFEKFFARQVHMRGDEMLRASPELVQSRVTAMAVSRGLPLTRSGGRPWSMCLAMTRSQQAMVDEHERALTSAGYSEHSAILTNIAQRADFMGPVFTGYVPALLRKSLLWSFRLRRLVMNEELFELQGYNMLGDNPEKRSCLAGALAVVPETARRSMAGNGMRVQSVGCAFLFLLACTTLQEQLP